MSVWTIATIVHEVHHGFDGRPVREFVALLVERVAAGQFVSAVAHPLPRRRRFRQGLSE
ncbi:three-helix bundle dimerization domain-containing protein [Nocardia sp. R16R-3T]